MSKKLAGGADALVLDVKCGDGAFMKTLEDARALARAMVAVGRAHGMRVKALITRMEEPLGWAIGNALEVMEAVEILKGGTADSDLARMSFRLAAEMLILGGAAGHACRGRGPGGGGGGQRRRHGAPSAPGWRPTAAIPEALDDFSLLPGSRRTVAGAWPPQGGYVQAIRGRALGLLAMELGAGRRSQDDVLDLGVGIRVEVRVGQKVEAARSCSPCTATTASASPCRRAGSPWARSPARARPGCWRASS